MSCEECRRRFEGSVAGLKGLQDDCGGLEKQEFGMRYAGNNRCIG